MKKDAKTIFAQSSDIKSRTFLEYRKDMKKKAIAEYEIMDWLEKKLSEIYKTAVKVQKSGGDQHIWFLRNGGITGNPDYKATIENREEYFEFQYSDRKDLKFFDFKVSKVGKKKNGKRIPYENKKFIYIIKPTCEYAIFSPKWIIENGMEAGVPAWGNRTAFRIPHDKFIKLFKKDKDLQSVILNIDRKNFILDFQHGLLERWKDKLSSLMQNVVDEKKIVKFIPNNLDSFFEICFILDNINKIPENANLWLIYLLTFISDNTTLEKVAKIVYSLDFLYSKIMLQQNEISQLTKKIDELLKIINHFSKDDGTYLSSLTEAPIEETRFALFSINILEDLIQDMIVNYKVNFNPITKIYQNIKDINKTYEVIVHGNQ